jgi:uncharacterized protein (UPF0276 family)
MFADLPTLGVGLGFRAPFRSDLFAHQEHVDFLEITAEHYLDTLPEKGQELDLLADHFVLIPHGLHLSLGSSEGIDSGHLGKLARLINRLNPPWWSEHIAFTHAGGIAIGHLAPLPFTHEAVEVLCRNIATVRRVIETPLLLENITYTVTLPGSEMTEAEFIAEVLERADCGLLLDVTNLYTNAINHGYDPGDFLDRLPLERVVQLHFAGGNWRGDVLVDSHAHPTPPEVWTWIEEVYARAPVKAAVLERDDNLPVFQDLLNELDQARELRGRAERLSQESRP